MEDAIKIKGHSCFKVQLKKIDCEYCIRKAASCKKDFARLKLQLQKQKRYEKYFFSNDRFIVPEVYSINKKNMEGFMEYISSALDVLDFMETASPAQIKWFCNMIKSFFDFCIKKSEMKNIPIEIINDKIVLIKKNCIENQHLQSYLEQIYVSIDILKKNIPDEICIPVGLCHGDLTLSNILIDIKTCRISLIDFLDSFIESPLMDLVKIDQDIVHGWTNTLCDKYEAKGRTKVTYDFISKELNKYCSKFSWTKHKNIFQQLNLLRVIQYAKDDKIIKYLLKELSKYH